MKLDIIHQGDCLEILKSIPDESIDLIFADPPYNMQTEGDLLRTNGTVFNGVSDAWDKFDDLQSYDNFCKSWLTECRRILKKDGAIWVIGSFQNIFRLGYIMQDLGFWILNDVIWAKPNAVPNFGGTRFQNSHETLLWCSKSKGAKYHFNYKTMKYINGGKQMKSVWNIGICIGGERIKDENGNKVHSTQKPESLLTNIILSSTQIGDVVLDPFFGTGTTGAIAKKYGRRYIGIEREQKYIAHAIKRINEVEVEVSDISKAAYDVKPPKVSLKTLIDKGYVHVGQKFYDGKREKFAILNSDGTVQYNDQIGSIHKISACMTNKTSCNGWNYFWCDLNGQFCSINSLRYLESNNN
jgi:site-specific DNA-methyltransferase (adenine-specific)